MSGPDAPALASGPGMRADAWPRAGAGSRQGRLSVFAAERASRRFVAGYTDR